MWGDQELLITTHEIPNLEFFEATGSNKVLCRLRFTQTSGTIMDVEGTVVSNTLISCPLSKHLEDDASITVELSFNNIEFYTVTETL